MENNYEKIESITKLIDTNGIQLETLIAGAGNPKFAVLLHGFPETNFSWRFQIPLLVSMGFEVYAPNLRGYGQSSKPPNILDYSVDKLVEDIGGLIDSGANGRETTLIGHDWGAAVAWAFAITKKRPLKQLVVMNVPHPAKMREGLRTWAQIKKSWYIFFFQLPFLPEFFLKQNNALRIAKAFRGSTVDKSRFPDEVLDVYRQNALIPNAIGSMLNYYRAAFAALTSKGGAALPILDTPTTMIWGEEDVALGIELTQGYEGLVTNFTLHRLPNVSHWVQQEAPEKVNEILSNNLL